MAANDQATSVEPAPGARRIWRLHVGLRTLHYAVLLGGALLAVAEAVGLVGMLGLVLLCLLVVLHVLGNALGTRLNRESTWATDFEEFDPALFPPLDASRTGLEPARRESSCPAHARRLARRRDDLPRDDFRRNFGRAVFCPGAEIGRPDRGDHLVGHSGRVFWIRGQQLFEGRALRMARSENGIRSAVTLDRPMNDCTGGASRS